MNGNVVNPDRVVDRLFPGRYLPPIFLFVLFAVLSVRLYPPFVSENWKPGLFYAALLATLGAIAVVGIMSTRILGQADVAGQLFLFTSFSVAQFLGVRAMDMHASVVAGMLLLMALAAVRGAGSLPLGASLPFIAIQIPIQGIPLLAALLFPALIVASFVLLFLSRDKPTLPPLASLAAAAIYLTRLSRQSDYLAIAYVIVGLCVVVIGAIYLYRYFASRLAGNVNIHVAEDFLIYALALAAIRLTDTLSPLQTYIVLASYFFAISLYYNAREKEVQFIAAGVVAIAALVPVLEEQLATLNSMGAVAFKVLAYCMIGTSAAAFSQLYHARLPNHLGKVLLVYASVLLLRQVSAEGGTRLLGSPEAIAFALLLCTAVLVCGCLIGHLDLHRPNEKLWAGILSPRLLVAIRRFGRSVGTQARSVPALGFFISMVGFALNTLRQAFGGRRYLALSHFSQIALVALAVPTFAICLQRAVELYFAIGRSSPPAILGRLGLGNGYPAAIWVFGAFVAAIVIFLAGQLLRVAYLRLFALLVPFAYVVVWTLSYGSTTLGQADILIAVLASMFVVAYVLARAVTPAAAFAGFDRTGALRVSAIVTGGVILWIVLFSVLIQPLSTVAR